MVENRVKEILSLGYKFLCKVDEICCVRVGSNHYLHKQLSTYSGKEEGAEESGGGKSSSARVEDHVEINASARSAGGSVVVVCNRVVDFVASLDLGGFVFLQAHVTADGRHESRCGARNAGCAVHK